MPKTLSVNMMREKFKFTTNGVNHRPKNKKAKPSKYAIISKTLMGKYWLSRCGKQGTGRWIINNG